MIDIGNTVFSVTALTSSDGFEMTRPDSFGTAFCVSAAVFVTAAHVVREAAAEGRVAITGSPTGADIFGAVAASSYQLLDDLDIAIVHAEVNVSLLNVWLTDRVQVLTELGSFGYPHAFSYKPDDPKDPRVEVVFRAYKGYVITIRGVDQLAGAPAMYEISCPFPPGMSGAPVLLTRGDEMAVAGVVLGCPKVRYRGFTQRVGAAIVADELLPRRIERTGQRLGQLPGVTLASLRGVTTSNETPLGPRPRTTS